MIKLLELFGDQGRPMPQDTPNEFAYLDYKKWAYKYRGRYKKEIEPIKDSPGKMWDMVTRWWEIWADKTGKKAFSRITNRQKFGRDLAFMMAKDNLVFTMGGKNAPDHKITLKNEGRIGFRLPDYSSEAVDALEDFVKAGEILNKQIKGKTFEKDDPIVQQILVLLDDDTEGELNQLTQNLLDLVSELPDREERRKIGFNR